jgi:hypothetical protein
MSTAFHVEKSHRKNKKFVAIFDKTRRVHFGARGYGDYTTYYKKCGRECAERKRKAYISRHAKTENWSDLRSAGALARYILWEYPSVPQAVEMYRHRLRSSIF